VKNLLKVIVAIFAASAVSAEELPRVYTWRQALDAIRIVETGGHPNEGIGVIGDGGGAAGPYQIHRAYHTDASERDKSLTLYSKCLTSKSYSERVMAAYMGRYAREATRRLRAGTGTLADVQKVARTHNGGPRGDRKKATLRYWNKVKKNLR